MKRLNDKNELNTISLNRAVGRSKNPGVPVVTTGCLNTLCQTSNHLLGIKNTLLSHKNGICTFMRCGNLTYDTWIWLKVTSMASTASNRKSAKNP